MILLNNFAVYLLIFKSYKFKFFSVKSATFSCSNDFSDMAKNYSRALRVGDQIQRELSALILREVKNPQLGMITITEVELSKDLSLAKIFVTVFNVSCLDEITKNLTILNEASGYLRTLLAKKMRLRFVPKLNFVFDDSIERAANMSALISKALNH